MPITKSAKKALRQEKRRGQENQKRRDSYKKAVRFFKENLSAKSLIRAYTEVDRAAKDHIIHPNKASHLKSQLAKMLTKSKPKKTASKSPKTTSPKIA